MLLPSNSVTCRWTTDGLQNFNFKQNVKIGNFVHFFVVRKMMKSGEVVANFFVSMLCCLSWNTRAILGNWQMIILWEKHLYMWQALKDACSRFFSKSCCPQNWILVVYLELFLLVFEVSFSGRVKMNWLLTLKECLKSCL